MKHAQNTRSLAERRSSGAKGFTLVELMTAVMVSAILMAIATPYFRDFIQGQRAKTAAYDLVSALTYARSEAIKRNTGVTVAPATGGWQNGWSVSAGASVLTAHDGLSGLTVAGPAGNLVYNSSGRLSATVNPFSISATNSTATPQCVNVDLSGLPTSLMGSC
jgi:type IV fimbrial biogenesis protein FimT